MPTTLRQTARLSVSSSVELLGAPASDVPDVWPGVLDYLKPAIERSGGRLSCESVLKALLKREMQLWIAVEKNEILGAMVTQVCVYPTGLKALTVQLIGGGDRRKWLHLWPHIEQWGAERGCGVAEIPRGRKGWVKILKGWNEMVFMEKEL